MSMTEYWDTFGISDSQSHWNVLESFRTASATPKEATNSSWIASSQRKSGLKLAETQKLNKSLPDSTRGRNDNRLCMGSLCCLMKNIHYHKTIPLISNRYKMDFGHPAFDFLCKIISNKLYLCINWIRTFNLITHTTEKDRKKYLPLFKVPSSVNLFRTNTVQCDEFSISVCLQNTVVGCFFPVSASKYSASLNVFSFFQGMHCTG